MKNRKWMALALAAAMVGSLTACGGGSGTADTTAAAAAADTTAAPAADTPRQQQTHRHRPETAQVWYTGPCGSPQSLRAR